MLKSLLCAVLLLAGGSAWAAQVVGVVAHLSGPLLDRKADGSVKVLGLKSEIENGDTLISEKNTYAQIRFVDNSEITLKPGTTFRIENFNYDAGKPDADSAAFDLVKGGLRSITGLLGKRNKEKFSLKTPTATIGIRGTTFVAQYVPPPPPQGIRVVDNLDSLNGLGAAVKTPVSGTAQTKQPRGADGPAALPPGVSPGAAAQTVNNNQGISTPLGNAIQQSMNPSGVPSAPGLAPGLHVSVTEGAIVVTNNGGALGFQAGQFGYVPGVNQPPVIVPPNTGLQFVPPPSFNGGGSGPQASSGGTSQEKSAVDCIVR